MARQRRSMRRQPWVRVKRSGISWDRRSRRRARRIPLAWRHAQQILALALRVGREGVDVELQPGAARRRLVCAGIDHIPELLVRERRRKRARRVLDDQLTRGGPSAVSPSGSGWNITAGTDSRKWFSVQANVNGSVSDAGGSSDHASLSFSIKPSSMVTLSTGPQWNRSRTVAQYVTSVSDPMAVSTYGAGTSSARSTRHSFR